LDARVARTPVMHSCFYSDGSYRAFPPRVVVPCAYIICLALPLSYDVPLLAFGFLAMLVGLSTFSGSHFQRVPLLVPTVVFLGVTALSIASSEDVGRSLQLSVHYLPGVLLFLLISQFRSGRQTRVLFWCLSLFSLSLSSALLLSALIIRGSNPNVWLSYLKIPLFVVVNDIAFLSVLIPLSVSLLLLRPHAFVKVVPLSLSVVLTICLACSYQSRTPILIALIALVTAVSLHRRRLLYVCAFSALLLVLIVDGLLGFPFVRKFALGFNGRIALWLTAFSMFVDAPILGHGPHTFGLFYLDYLHRLEIPAWISVDTRPLSWAHNVYLQVLAEQGIIGALALLTLITCAMRLAWRTHRHSEGEVHILNSGALSALITLCMAGMFDASLMREWFVTMFFVILGIVSHLSTLTSIERGKIK